MSRRNDERAARAPRKSRLEPGAVVRRVPTSEAFLYRSPLQPLCRTTRACVIEPTGRDT